MCMLCGQPDWYCRYKPQHNFKQVKNEKTGYSTLTLDFQKMSIIKKHSDTEEVYDFPVNWDAITDAEKAEWILEKMKR